MFLRVESARAGALKGEANDREHAGWMDISGWAWGMKAQQAMGNASAQRTSLDSLVVTKSVDSATTGLMTVMRTNDPVKKAVLHVRKAAGKLPMVYFEVTIEQGRITDYDISNAGEELVERIEFSFKKISIDYTGQTAAGGKVAPTNFNTEIE
ncbi:Hcp family type VI secretion system effector [Derxia gummosa]|uniref:Hcp family type VI secretion system effector n=1 Tax=Derxia gummosa DSM 723 TaxID=1121388 RepID=A0A8B6XCP4_9BURK|nr:type VI secretion system tube protein Hcp [Derxia gummosa]